MLDWVDCGNDGLIEFDDEYDPPGGDIMSFEGIIECSGGEGPEMPRPLLSPRGFIIGLLPVEVRMRLFWPDWFLLWDFRTVSRTGPHAGQAGSLHFR
jgi:hypothetical protein